MENSPELRRRETCHISRVPMTSPLGDNAMWTRALGFGAGVLACILLSAGSGWARRGETAAASGGCPLRFDQQTTGLPAACTFIGRYNADCGQDAVAIFAGDGTALVVGLAVSAVTPTLFVPAQVLSATEGKLVRWRQDLELHTAPSAGSVTLDPDGRRLHVTLVDPDLRVGECRFGEFVGEFAGMAPAGQPMSPVPQPAPIREAASAR